MNNQMITKQRSKNLTSLTGMRIFAALLVILFHASLSKMLNPFENENIATSYALIFKNAGWLGVSFFFILSGFVLTWSANPHQSKSHFWLKRLGKIFPNHIVTWGIMLFFFSDYVTNSSAWLPNLFLVSSWSNNIDIFVSINQPSWTLCSELLFYMLFPVLFALIRKVPNSKLWHILATTFFGLLATQLAITFWISDTSQLNEWPLSENQWWLAYNFPPFRLYEFIAGMLMARLLQAGVKINLSLSTSTGLVLLSYIATYFVPFQYSLNVVTFIPLCLLIAVGAQNDLEGKKSILNARLTIWLGEVSFGIYMIHYIVLISAKKILSGELYGLGTSSLIIVLCFIASIVGGYILYRFIELPIMKQLSEKNITPITSTTERQF